MATVPEPKPKKRKKRPKKVGIKNRQKGIFK